MQRKFVFIVMGLFMLNAMLACTPKGNAKPDFSDEKSVEKNEGQKGAENETKLDVWYDGEKPFVFDYHKDYPVTDIKLSDMAKVTYVQLETREDVLLRLRGSCSSNETCMTDEHIYLNEEQSQLYVFTHDGKFVRCIDRQGGGPGEYLFISSYVVDTSRRNLFISDRWRKKLKIYDLEGNFLREHDHALSEIVSLNDSLLVGYDGKNKGKGHFMVLRKSDGALLTKLPFNLNKPYYEDIERMQYGRLTTTPKGVLMASMASDTIFEVRKDLSFLPRMVDASNYGTSLARALPTMETERYLMFYVFRAHNMKVNLEERFYVYDKKEHQIYQMRPSKNDSYWRLLDNTPHLNNWSKSQNPNVAIRTRLVHSVDHEFVRKHGSPELNRLVREAEEDANPILEIMKFHSVDTVKK